MKKCMVKALCLVIIGSCLTGCGKEIEQKNDSLHVYSGYDDKIMDYAVEIFRDTYPDLPVTYTENKDMSDTEALYEYNHQLSAQLMSGEGADVFFIQDYWDVDKLLQSGAFADLTEIYDSMDVFEDADFRKVILDAGVIDGKRMFLPMECDIPFFLTTRQALQETGFQIEKCIDFDGFLEESWRFMQNTNNQRKLFRMDLTARDCLFWAGYPIVENGEIVWDIEETRRYYEWYKEIYEQQRGEEEYFFGDLIGAAAVRDHKCLFENSLQMRDDLDTIRALYTIGEPVMLPCYNREKGITATIKKMVAVRANSENLDNVKKFLEILFQEETMRTFGAYRGGISVRKGVEDDYYEGYLIEEPYKTGVNGFSVELPVLQKKDFDTYYAYADKINKVVYERGWRRDFRDEMSHYLDGEVSYEEAAEQAKKKLEFYLSE